MYKYYRVSLADLWNDGDGWSVNDWYEQPYLVGIEESKPWGVADIVKALKDAGLLKRGLHYDGWTIECDDYNGRLLIERNYSKGEPCILQLIWEPSANHYARYFPNRMTKTVLAN